MDDKNKNGPRIIEVPANVYVQCPLTGKRLRPVRTCLDCEHYVTLHERIESDAIPFAQRMMVGCKYPTGRLMFELENIDVRPK